MLSVQEKKRLLGFLGDDATAKDITSAIMPDLKAAAVVKCNETCILSGIEEAAFLFKSSGLKVKAPAKNGSKVMKGKAVLRISGGSRKILSVERVALNVLGKMSGVATVSRKASEIADGKTKIYLTRKTTPGFSVFEKKACIDGGVMPHRKNLADAVLLKENHLVFFKSIADAVRAARKKYAGKKIGVEAESSRQAVEAAKAGAHIILLDNFSAQSARKAISAIKKINKHAIIELSGGIGLKNLKQYVNLRPERISMGQLTKEAKIIDFSLDIRRV